MKRILILTTALLATAPAFAQTATTQENPELMNERMMPFYTDQTMATLKPDEEMVVYYQSLSVEDQAMLKSRCDEILLRAGSKNKAGDAGTSGDGTTAGNGAAISTAEGNEVSDSTLAPACEKMAAY